MIDGVGDNRCTNSSCIYSHSWQGHHKVIRYTCTGSGHHEVIRYTCTGGTEDRLSSTVWCFSLEGFQSAITSQIFSNNTKNAERFRTPSKKLIFKALHGQLIILIYWQPIWDILETGLHLIKVVYCGRTSNLNTNKTNANFENVLYIYLTDFFRSTIKQLYNKSVWLIILPNNGYRRDYNFKGLKRITGNDKVLWYLSSSVIC